MSARARFLVMLIVIALIGGGALYVVLGGSRAAAASALVSVVETSLEAQKAGGGAFTTALDGDVLTSGDHVRTDASGRGFLTFFDGSTLEVEPGAQVTVHELASNVDGSIVIRLEQTLGVTWASVRKFTNANSRFEIKTPASTAVVRGTGFKTTVLSNLTSLVETFDGTVVVSAQGIDQQSPAGTFVQTVPGQAPSAPQTAPQRPGLRFTSTAGTNLTVVDSKGLGCGSGRADAAGCTEGSVVLREIVPGAYTVLMAAVTSVNATLTMEGQTSATTVSTQALTRPMSRGELVRTTLPITLDSQGRPVLGVPTPFESLTSICGADARGRAFVSGTFEDRNDALRQFASASKNQSITIVYSEAELTAALQNALGSLQGLPLTVGNGKVHIDPNGIQFTADLAAGPIRTHAKADLSAGSEGGRLALRLRSLDLGPFTSFVSGQITERIEKGLASIGDSVPATVRRVALRPGCLAVLGDTR